MAFVERWTTDTQGVAASNPVPHSEITLSETLTQQQFEAQWNSDENEATFYFNFEWEAVGGFTEASWINHNATLEKAPHGICVTITVTGRDTLSEEVARIDRNWDGRQATAPGVTTPTDLALDPSGFALVWCELFREKSRKSRAFINVRVPMKLEVTDTPGTTYTIAYDIQIWERTFGGGLRRSISLTSGHTQAPRVKAGTGHGFIQVDTHTPGGPGASGTPTQRAPISSPGIPADFPDDTGPTSPTGGPTIGIVFGFHEGGYAENWQAQGKQRPIWELQWGGL